MERNRFTRVAAFDIRGVLESVQVAGDLWAGAALRGIGSWRVDDDELVAEIVAALLSAATHDEPARFVTVFEHLVVAFARIEGNQVRLRTLANVLPQVRRLGRKLPGRLDPQAVGSFTHELLAATARRDGRAAVDLIDDYVTRLGGVLTSL